MDCLMDYHSLDIQWAIMMYCGWRSGRQTACMCNMLRISAKYGNLSILEDAYGINMLPLARLAMDKYADDPAYVSMWTHQMKNYDNDYAEMGRKDAQSHFHYSI